ncbi:MAG: hypothetical protein WCJ85_11140 [Chitinophagaceae bacterium]
MRKGISIFFLCFAGLSTKLNAQLIITGTVYDSSKINFIPDVRVVSTGGLFAITDSLGIYRIRVNEKDSIYFVYKNKPTQKFSVKLIINPQQFDISLKTTYRGKYSLMKEVTVFSKSYRQDSLENRQTYARIFNHQRPGIKTNIGTDGVVGADPNEIINLFRFKRNKQLRKFQLRLEEEEKENYINYRFNKILIKRITHLQGAQLDYFLLRYRPNYDFLMQADELTFNQYVLNCSYEYKIAQLQKTP